ncbi:Rv1355c family protein [Parapedobacter tibetensis]|uniref:Rv1355c family protein n=1 Tax=Parapedobacter tibetensis TaxID=2972951 RepID=UPI00214D9143|nr:Rv1355c family protein [Parapedobacter tibetensis]
MMIDDFKTGPLKHRITSNQQLDKETFQPLFFRIGNPEDREGLAKLLERKPYIQVFDTIEPQLKELIKSSLPTETLEESRLCSLIENHVGDTPFDEYGVWVYYPWNEKLVHLLDENEFAELRTNRNKYKITAEEQFVLTKKKIGVIGLSVGQSVSLTLAMERGFGELRIADFDELEITNLNRLRSGVHNMGLKKTVIVAREIAEIDPYLKITCFHDGITTENLESFLLDGGKLDVLIDECDGVDVKINCRLAAKKHHIPVLMEASDRGTVDIERFDLEPDRPILHGFVEHLDISNFKNLKTNEQKLPYILAFAGVETLSIRMKASAIEVGQSISTWPQLASAVTMGGGITADVCRRVLLDLFHQSGRYFIDLEELIDDTKPAAPNFKYTKKSLNDEEMMRVAKRLPAIGNTAYNIDNKMVKELVRTASIAPSPGNNQPWKWYFDGKRLYLFHDIERSESYGDFENMASYMTFGTAIENLNLKAKEMGVEVTEMLFPLPDEPLLIAAFSFSPSQPVKSDLIAHIHLRCTNRHLGTGMKLDTKSLNEIRRSIAPIEGATLKFIEDKDDLQRLALVAGKSEKLRLFIPQGHYDLFEKELRWTVEETEKTKDGLDVRTLGLSTKDTIGFRVARDPKAMQLIADWNLGKALENMTSDLIGTSSAVGLIAMPTFDAINCLAAGKAVERLWITANKNLISLQPVLAPVLHFTRLRYGKGGDMPIKIQNEFAILNEEFDAIFDITPLKEVPLFLFRLFKGKNPTVSSLRLNLNEVFFQREN